MADDQNGDGKGMPGFSGRSRPPQTIDLKAEDVTKAEEVTRPDPAGSRAGTAEASAPPSSGGANKDPSPAPEATNPDPLPNDPPADDRSGAEPHGAADGAASSSRLGAIGAATGLAALLLVLALGAGLWSAGLFEPDTAGLVALRKRVDTLESQQRALAARPQAETGDAKQLQALSQRLTALEDKTGQAQPPGALAGKLTQLEQAAALLAHKADENATALREARGRAEAAVTIATTAQNKAIDTASAQQNKRLDVAQNISRDIAPLDKRLNALEAATKQASDNAAQKGTVAALSARLATLEAAFKTAEDRFQRQNAAASQTLHALIALQALRTAVERGAPYAAELDAMKPFAPNAQATAPLAPFATTGLPTEDTLTRDFNALMPALSQATAPKADGNGILGRLQASAERLVRVHRVGDVPGDTPDALLAQAQAGVRAHDFAGAAAALEKLPPGARAPARSWIGTVKARSAALSTLQQLAGVLPVAGATPSGSSAADPASQKPPPQKPQPQTPPSPARNDRS